MPHSELSNIIYYPHFASNDRWGTGIAACNPLGKNATVKFEVYSRNGGQPVSTAEYEINANSQLTPLTVKQMFPDMKEEEGWIKAISNTPITGLEIFMMLNYPALAGLNACANPGKELHFAKVVNNEDLYSSANPYSKTGITLVNTGDKKADVEVKADDDTKIVAEEKLKAKYSIEYLKKMIQGSKLADKVILQFNKDYPLKIEYKVVNKLQLSFILAPRVDND